MPVHFKVADHDANPVAAPCGLQSPLALAYKRPSRHLNSEDPIPIPPTVWQSTFSGNGQPFESYYQRLIKRRKGLVSTVFLAYNEHHHLILRPDDIWIAILSQFSIYVNSHAEELRSHFVTHQDGKDLKITFQSLPVNFGRFAELMSDEIAKNVVDEDLKDWILPQFTTTTANDTVVSAVLLMSTLKSYFSYRAEISMCGLPSVTLEGEKSDWENILFRLEKLPSFGPEPTYWASLLRPVISRFVQAFDGNPDVDFWNRVCSLRIMGSGSNILSGWITVFNVWDQSGRWRGGRPQVTCAGSPLETGHYPQIFVDNVTSGSCEVNVIVQEVGGPTINCKMVSGHVACLVGGQRRDTISPFPAWFILRPGDDA